MANTKVTQHVIANNAISASMIQSAAVTDAKLHATLDLSGKTLTLPATAIPSASTATTQAASDNSTKLATTAYVTTAIGNLVDSAPGTLNTLNELAAALGDDANFSSTITTSLATKAPINNPTFTGSISHASDLTLDAGGDIVFDADGGDFRFKDNGTQQFIIDLDDSAGDVMLRTNASNKDMIFQGNVGGSNTTVLTLDMSEAGFATFNSGGSFGGTGALKIPVGTTGQRPSATTGQIRWNSTDGALEVYNGSAWTAVGTGSSNKVLDTFTGNGSTTTFTLSVTPANEDAIMVFIDGVYQEKADYILTNNSLALDVAPALNEKISVHTTTASVHDGTSAVNQQFTATAGQTAFTLSQDPKSENNTQVYINGVYQQKTDYTVVGTTLTFDTGLTVGDVVEVNMFTVATLGNTDTMTEGVSNLYHTTARARGAISVSGNAISYNSSTGVISANYEEGPVFTSGVQAQSLQINPASGGYTPFIFGGNSTPDGTLPWLGLFNNTNIASATYGWAFYDSSSNGSLQLWNRNNSTTGVNVLTVLRGGYVGIGASTPGSNLHVKDDSGEAKLIIQAGSNTNSAILQFGDSIDVSRGGIEYTSTDDMIFSTNNFSEAIKIRYTGNVGIGESLPTEKLHVGGNIKMQATTAIVTYQNAANTWNIGLDAADSSFKFKDGTDERIRIDNSGNFLVGTQTAAPQNFSSGSGTQVSDGYVAIARGGSLAFFNRISTDGDLVEFKKNGSIVGTVATTSNRISIGSNDVGLFFDSTNERFTPIHQANQVDRDGAIDLGYTSSRFKSLYLSNAVYAADIIANGSGGLALQTDEGTKRLFIKDNGDVKVGEGAVGSATSAPLHVAKYNTDIQAIFGDNNATIDDPTIRVLGRDSANTSARFSYLGLDADGNYGFIGYNAGSGTPVQALSILTDGKVGIGDTTPRVKLEVHGGANQGILLKPNSQIAYTPTSSDFYNGLTLENSGSSHAFSLAYGQGGRLKFSYFDNSSTYTEMAHMRTTGDIYPAGNMVMQSGQGINFAATGQASGMSNELLDDYEEGTWTPALTGNTGSAPTVAYQFRSGYYIKVGNICMIRFGIRVSSISGGSGVATITGLPYTAKLYGSFQQPAAFVNAQGLSTSANGPALFYVVDSGTHMQGRIMNNADTVLPLSYFQAYSWVIGNLTYDVA